MLLYDVVQHRVLRAMAHVLACGHPARSLLELCMHAPIAARRLSRNIGSCSPMLSVANLVSVGPAPARLSSVSGAAGSFPAYPRRVRCAASAAPLQPAYRAASLFGYRLLAQNRMNARAVHKGLPLDGASRHSTSCAALPSLALLHLGLASSRCPVSRILTLRVGIFVLNTISPLS